MKLAVVGSRDFVDYAQFLAHFEECLFLHGPFSKIISGGAAGVDSLAKKAANERGIPFVEVLPETKYARLRDYLALNNQIVGRADVLFAICKNQSRGTLDAVAKARKARKPVFLVEC